MQIKFVSFAHALLVLGLAGCLQDRVIDARTQILLSVNTSDESLREQMTHLRATIRRREGDRWEEGSSKTFPRAAISWPVDLPIIPGVKADRAKQFEVVVDALDGAQIVAQARAISRFLPGERRVLALWLEVCEGQESPLCDDADCRGESCKVCRAGRCTTVDETNPSDLPEQEPGRHPGGVTDAAVERDASRERDARVDGSDDSARADAARADAAAKDAGATNDEDAAVADASVEPGNTCTEEGQLRCPMSGTVERERCEGGTWVAAEPCESGHVCDGASDPAGGCRELLAVCAGNAGRAVCDGNVMQLCDAAGNSMGMEVCATASHCQLGLAVGACAKCLVGEHHCEGAELQVCAEDGQSFVFKEECASAALCNEAAGKCGEGCTAGSKVCMGDVLRRCKANLTGFENEKTCEPGLCDQPGQQCDVCVPNHKSCMGNSVRTCNAQGQGYTMQACTAPRGVCTGNGVCVECTSASPCAQPAKECMRASCDVANGTCATSPKPEGTACSTGVCDGAGDCVQCLDGGDCARIAGKPVCYRNRCVECVVPADCGSGKTCQANSCIERVECGDRIKSQNEACDESAPGWSPWTCENCKKKTIYTPCLTDAQCNVAQGELCLGAAFGYGFLCTVRCDFPGRRGTESGCPQPPGGMIAGCSDGEAYGVCFAYGCDDNKDCAPGMSCQGAEDPTTSACVGCKNGFDCASNQTCYKPNPSSSGDGYCR